MCHWIYEEASNLAGVLSVSRPQEPDGCWARVTIFRSNDTIHSIPIVMVKGSPSNPVQSVTNTIYSRLGSKQRLSQDQDLVLIPNRWCFIRETSTLPRWRVQEFDPMESLVAPNFSLTSIH